MALNAGVVQLVECLLAKEKVTGSSPVARSFISLMAAWPPFLTDDIKWRRGQVVRQGSAKPSSRVQIPSTPQFFCGDMNWSGIHIPTIL